MILVSGGGMLDTCFDRYFDRSFIGLRIKDDAGYNNIDWKLSFLLCQEIDLKESINKLTTK